MRKEFHEVKPSEEPMKLTITLTFYIYNMRLAIISMLVFLRQGHVYVLMPNASPLFSYPEVLFSAAYF